MNILIFGKDGQLGKAFRALIDSTSLSQIHQIQYVGRDECDLSQAEKVSALLNTTKPDLIINAAAYTAVDKAETEVELANAWWIITSDEGVACVIGAPCAVVFAFEFFLP